MLKIVTSVQAINGSNLVASRILLDDYVVNREEELQVNCQTFVLHIQYGAKLAQRILCTKKLLEISLNVHFMYNGYM